MTLPQVLEHVPGKQAILLADDFGSAHALGQHLRHLLEDEKAYEAHHRWDLDAFARSPAVAQCPWQCKVCEWVAVKRAGRLRQEG